VVSSWLLTLWPRVTKSRLLAHKYHVMDKNNVFFLCQKISSYMSWDLVHYSNGKLVYANQTAQCGVSLITLGPMPIMRTDTVTA
jgi:hypothetical protein